MFALEDIPAFLPDLLRGAWLTIVVSVLAFMLALVVGLFFAIMRMSRVLPLRVVAAVYIQFIRGTPLLLQLFFIYYVMPYSGVVLSPFVSAVIGLTANYAAYMAEVFRSGMQAIRIIIPSIGNFFVSIFKDSALVSVITMRDLMFSGQLLASATFKHFEIYAMVAAIYFMISYPTALFVEWVERRFEIGGRPGSKAGSVRPGPSG